MIIFGQYEQNIINVHDLVVLPQVRKIRNEKIDDLIDSIHVKGLLNPIDVARLTYDELNAHIGFINKLWKKDAKIDNFKEMNGFYYVVIAGHTRLLAIKEIAKREKKDCSVVAKIHPVRNSEEILAIQLDENIHSEPRIEERAIAIIETYRLGLDLGRWKDKDEFIAKNKHRFRTKILSAAVDFASSPVEVQNYVFSENIPFAVGVELGKIYPLVVRYEAEFAEGKQLDMHIKHRYDVILGRLQAARKRIGRSLEIINGCVNEMGAHFLPQDDSEQFSLTGYMERNIKEESKRHALELKRERDKIITELTGKQFHAYQEYLNLSGELSGEDLSDEVQATNTLHNQYVLKRLRQR